MEDTFLILIDIQEVNSILQIVKIELSLSSSQLVLIIISYKK